VAVWEGLGLEHQRGGVQAVRAVTALSALCGYVDVAGGSRLTHPPKPPFWGELLPGLYRLRTAEPAPPWPEDRPLGSLEHPLYEVFNRQAQGMLVQRAILKDDPYPVRALLVFGCNPAVTLPSARRMAAALEKLELLVVVDPFLSETAARADLVLPASTFAESGAGEGGEDDATVARSALLPPQHQSWPDWKVVFELARALDLGRYFPWQTFSEALEAPSRPELGPEDRAPRAPAAPAPAAAPPRYPTPTGKLELASTLLQKFGADPLPGHQGPPQPAADYPLRLITGRRTRAFINSQFRTVASIRRLGQEPYAEIHPKAAAAADVRDGDVVEIASPHGSVTMRARVTDRVHPEVVSVPAGWGAASANALTDADALDPISGFPQFRAGICRVSVRRT